MATRGKRLVDALWSQTAVRAVCGALLLGVAGTSAAQGAKPASSAVTPTSTSPAWEIETRGGLGLFTFNGGVGNPLSIFPAGAGAPLLSGNAFGAPTSSWFFGWGTENLNLALPSSVQATGLYRALLQPDTYRRQPSFGVGISHRLSRRLTAEVSIDVGAEGAALGGTSVKEIADAVANYAPAFHALFQSAPGVFTGASVTAVSSYRSGGHPVLATAALAVRLAPRGRVHPFLTFGAGASVSPGPAPQSTLVGHYAFAFTGTGPMSLVLGQAFPVPIDETDRVTVQSGNPGVRPVAIAGVGFSLELSRRSSFRLEGRAVIGRDDPIILTATPSHVAGQPIGTLDYPTIGPLQFSTDPRFPSSLSDPVTGLRTFNGGNQVRLVVNAGYVLRLGLTHDQTLPPHQVGPSHRFFDKLNVSLTAMELGAEVVDMAVTQYGRRNIPGTVEGDPLARWFVDRGWPGESLELALSGAEDIGLCYLFHRTGHHELERLIPMLNAGISSTGASADLVYIHDSHALGLGK